jgi:hypothetical protein
MSITTARTHLWLWIFCQHLSLASCTQLCKGHEHHRQWQFANCRLQYAEVDNVLSNLIATLHAKAPAERSGSVVHWLMKSDRFAY